MFNIYFFKEKQRNIQIEEIINFFEEIGDCRSSSSEDEFKYTYTHPVLNDYSCSFILSKKSVVPEIYRISPKYLDLKFRIEFPILTPTYIAVGFLNIVKKLTQIFGYYVYCEFFKDAIAFKIDIVQSTFELVKDYYLKKYQDNLNEYDFISKDRLTSILRYIDEMSALKTYYSDLKINVPEYHCLKDNQNKLCFAIEWKDLTATLVPSQVDYVFYKHAGVVSIYKYSEILELINKYLLDVPSFISGTKITPENNLRKISKTVLKSKLEKQITLEPYNLERIMDV